MKSKYPQEYKLVSLRECPVETPLCDNPQLAFDYWQRNVVTHPYFDREKETFVVLFLNVRKKILGHNLVAIGIIDSVIIHPREVFKAAIVGGASSIIIMHNHPSGDPTPSEADIKITRELKNAGSILKIEMLDHVIVGNKYCSLRELGYFY